MTHVSPFFDAAADAASCDACAALTAHSEQFRPAVIRVTDKVYVAVGYSASNVTLIQGDTGAIIIDTGANPTDAQAIVAAFGARMQRPVRAIVYTHGHPDHVGGATVFAGADQPAIYSHQLLLSAKPDMGRGRRDGGDAFGVALPDALFINAGTQLEYGRQVPHTRAGYLPPTHTFAGQTLALTLDGVPLQLIHTPGETDENIAVWLPTRHTLLPGDDVLQTFPNIAPLRGLPTRPAAQWVSSLDRMIALAPHYLVPGHMRPISGASAVLDVLTTYRDGIQFVLERTLAGIAQGLTPDELVQQVQLPDALAQHPFLQPWYGTVAWTVRGIYAQQVGWFDGNATQIFPLTPLLRAQKIIAMAGGPSALQAAAEQSLADGEYQWAAEQADYLLAVTPGDPVALGIKAQALTVLGLRQKNATARNYYLTTAQYLQQQLTTGAALPASQAGV